MLHKNYNLSSLVIKLCFFFSFFQVLTFTLHYSWVRSINKLEKEHNLIYIKNFFNWIRRDQSLRMLLLNLWGKILFIFSKNNNFILWYFNKMQLSDPKYYEHFCNFKDIFQVFAGCASLKCAIFAFIFVLTEKMSGLILSY